MTGSRTPSNWREFKFAYHQTIRAIEPQLPLDEMIRDWREIAAGLSEPPRRRRVQTSPF